MKLFLPRAPRPSVALLAALAAFTIPSVAPAQAKEPAPLFREFVGLNGHTVNFKPDLYQPVCRVVRD